MEQTARFTQMIDGALSNVLQLRCPETLLNAMRYSVSAGGKRLRPTLLLMAAEACGGKAEEAMSFAVAAELIHTYSLIHDDLPAMDDDDLRRGRPTNHKVFGEGMAILAGDGLLNLAYEVMIKACLFYKEPKFLKAADCLAEGAGALGMVGGQAVDLQSENTDISAKTILFIHSNKTASLIRACVKAGAILGGADMAKTNLLERAGLTFGLAFQIWDDILDVTSTADVLGKPVLSDAKNRKATYVAVHGMKKAREDYDALSENALKLFKEAGADDLAAYAASLFQRQK